MGRPSASPTTQVNQQPQEYHFQSVSQSPETIDDAPPHFETCNDENQQESAGNEPSEVSKENGYNNQLSSQPQKQSHLTGQAAISSEQTQATSPMAFPPRSSQANASQAAQFPPQNRQMRSPAGPGSVQTPRANPQAFPPQLQGFPPSQDEPQAFPLQASTPQAFPPQLQGFPPSQDEPQAFPLQASTPQAFPPQPQAFPPSQDEPQAFPPRASTPQAFPPQPQVFPPSQDEPQVFPPQASPQAFPPQSQAQPQAFPPSQGTPQAFPPQADQQPQAFPSAQDEPQIFPPPEGQPQAFLPQQATFQQQQNGMQFPQNANFFLPSTTGGHMGVQAMPASPFHPTPQMMMSNATPGFPVINQNPVIQVPTEDWKTGLFGCMNDPTNALVTACFPCVTFGQIAEIIDSGQTSCATSGLLYGLIAFLIAMPCLMSCTYRTKLRGRFGLIETPAPDWLIHCFCGCCALCQEYRELKERGLDPSIGWLGNVTKQKQMVQLAAMTPPVKQTIMG